MSIFGEKCLKNINIVICSWFYRLRREFNRKIYGRACNVRKHGNKIPHTNI
jgi:hypothetical protein